MVLTKPLGTFFFTRAFSIELWGNVDGFLKYYVNFQATGMNQKGNTLDHDFYVVVGKQCRTENAYAGHQHNILI